MTFTAFLQDTRSVSMRYDEETDRLMRLLSQAQGVTPGVIVRLAFRALPDTLDEGTVAIIRDSVNRMKGRRTTWVEDGKDRARLDALVERYGVSRRGILRYAVRQYARRMGVKVEAAA